MMVGTRGEVDPAAKLPIIAKRPLAVLNVLHAILAPATNLMGLGVFFPFF